MLLLYLSVDHACLKFIIDGSICGNSLFIKFLLVLPSSPQILQLCLVETPLLLKHFCFFFVHSFGSSVDKEFVESVLVV